MTRISLVEAVMAIVLLVPAAALLGGGVAWAVGAPVWTTALLTAAIPPAGLVLAFAADVGKTLRRRKALRRLASLARHVALPPIPGLLWDPKTGLEAAPRWEPSAHERLRLQAVLADPPPIRTPPGWDEAARLYYGRSVLNDPPGLWVGQDGRLRLAHLRIAGAPFFPEDLPDRQDTP